VGTAIHGLVTARFHHEGTKDTKRHRSLSSRARWCSSKSGGVLLTKECLRDFGGSFVTFLAFVPSW
jgi:hypothetical protein